MSAKARFYDEMFAAPGQIRPGYKSFADWLHARPEDELAQKRAEAEGPTTIRRFSYRIYPEPAAKAALRRVFGSCRFVYN
ncbi:MAG: helix-turn-helix domain-containing protein, partial [Pedobacter sp.]|nr:helix-turn-helix domain-containing protein [Pedobacter sp.]